MKHQMRIRPIRPLAASPGARPAIMTQKPATTSWSGDLGSVFVAAADVAIPTNATCPATAQRLRGGLT